MPARPSARMPATAARAWPSVTRAAGTRRRLGAEPARGDGHRVRAGVHEHVAAPERRGDGAERARPGEAVQTPAARARAGLHEAPQQPLGLLRGIARALAPARRDDRLPVHVGGQLPARGLLGPGELGRQVRDAVDRVDVEYLAPRLGDVDEHGVVLGRPAVPWLAAVVVGPDDLAEEALATERGVEGDLDVMDLALVEVHVERAVLGQQAVRRDEARDQPGGVVVEGVGVARPAGRGARVAVAAEARRRGGVARRRRAPAGASRAGVEGRIDVDEVEGAPGQQREHGGVVALDEQVVVERERALRVCDQSHGGANLPCTAVARRLLALAAVAAATVAVVLALRGGGSPSPALLPGGGAGGDPLAWTADRSHEYAQRAAAGLAHVLYAKSPGGLPASVARTKSWRPMIEAVARESDVNPDTLEAIVLLESAGEPEAMASNSFRGAVGLTQILAETGQNLLGMHVDPVASRRLTRRIARAEKRGQTARARRLRAERRRGDERFDPRKSLAATARYLAIAKARLGRDDLAIASYHMGIGNLQTALRRYGTSKPIPYAQLYFDSTPLRHPAAQRFLASLGDDSSTYLWRIEAARAALHLQRTDRPQLERLAQLHAARNSAEEVLHPPDHTKAFGDPGALHDAYDDGDIVHLPAAWLRARGIAIDPGMGALSSAVGEKPSLYRGLRREALATLGYVGRQVRAI